ncbi:hypothetical protein KUCAC02_026426, partial [Chaenocephalus aceratus]
CDGTENKTSVRLGALVSFQCVGSISPHVPRCCHCWAHPNPDQPPFYIYWNLRTILTGMKWRKKIIKTTVVRNISPDRCGLMHHAAGPEESPHWVTEVVIED